VRCFLDWQDEQIEVAGSLTVGRHLENDLMIAGEDVLDYHVRIEPTLRGITAHPLGEATVNVNGVEHDEPVGLMVGDTLKIGQVRVTVAVQYDGGVEAEQWWLRADTEDGDYKVVGELDIGRSDGSAVLLDGDHVSRNHARIVNDQSRIWIQDLDSANGTQVNGQLISGACRLFHGDQITFDTLGFQLVGQGGDLTPVRAQDAPAPNSLLVQHTGSLSNDTTEINAVAIDDDQAIEVPDSSETGAFFLGVSEPVNGMTFRTKIGRTIVGREDACDIVLQDPTVSSRHAEINVRPEGCTITNLMSTNGTRVNGEEVQNATLADGDVLRFGRVAMVFKDVPMAVEHNRMLRLLQAGLLIASLVVAAGLLVMFLRG
jgi:pSer/pThr/pTyr-binding forkhead associated (FHA) protein